MTCIFCSVEQKSIVAENRMSFAIKDRFPVSPGHTLVISKRHVSSFFDLTDEEHRAVLHAAKRARVTLDAELHPDGYNIGVNVGTAAGQTVWHVHVHVIPRFDGDMEDPTGGVRHCVAGKGHYSTGGPHEPAGA